MNLMSNHVVFYSARIITHPNSALLYDDDDRECIYCLIVLSFVLRATRVTPHPNPALIPNQMDWLRAMTFFLLYTICLIKRWLINRGRHVD